ncbi:hypothetical protein ACG7TL_006570 [Trametes sanguinea]
MIVRPTVSSSFSTRRSQSTPPRRRSNSAGAASAEASPALPASAHLLVQALHPSSKTIPDPLLRSLSGKRKLFRLKRPSGSHSDKSGLHEDHVPPTSPSSSSAVPPRPARNPARLHSYQGPSTADAPDPSPAHDGALSDHPRSDAQEMKPTGDAADWEFPLPRGSEFPLQRKKSKSSKGSAKRAMQDENAKNELLFSTLDRAILEELRQKMRAREDQFVIRSGRKYHAFPAEEVPYPRSYDRQVVDLDVWDNLWQQQLGGSITMHVFKTAPARVLELGCGTGTWILNAAREWKDSLFVGVDVVPLHPDLIQVGSFDLASRITWVQANFRIVRVARGVPEDKWDGLLEEVTRVMKPGGAFEMWEEDLRFPGSSRETDSVIDAPEPRHVSPPTPPQTDSSHSSEQATPLAVYALPVHRSLAFSYSFDDVLRVKGALLQDDTLRPLRAVPSNSKISSTPMLLRTIERPPINPHDHSLLETIYDEMHAGPTPRPPNPAHPSALSAASSSPLAHSSIASSTRPPHPTLDAQAQDQIQHPPTPMPQSTDAASPTMSNKRARHDLQDPNVPADDGFVHDPDAGESGQDDEDDDDKPKGDKKAGRRKIKIEFIQDKSRRHITFSKRKAGIMKKAYELSTLTGTQVLLLVVSETGLVYTFTTAKLQPLVTQPEGKNLIQACLSTAPQCPWPTHRTFPESEDAPGASGDASDRGNPRKRRRASSSAGASGQPRAANNNAQNPAGQNQAAAPSTSPHARPSAIPPGAPPIAIPGVATQMPLEHSPRQGQATPTSPNYAQPGAGYPPPPGAGGDPNMYAPPPHQQHGGYPGAPPPQPYPGFGHEGGAPGGQPGMPNAWPVQHGNHVPTLPVEPSVFPDTPFRPRAA